MGERMQIILRLIMSSRLQPIKSKDLLDELEKLGYHYNIKTIHATVKQINAFFYPLIQDTMILSKRGTGLVVNKNVFEDGQLQLLIDSINYNKDLSFKEKNQLVDKLMHFSDESQRKRLIFHMEKDEKPFSLMLNLSTIMKAIAERKNIIFDYVSYRIEEGHPREVASKHGNKNGQYVVSPYTIVLDNNHYYLVGYYNKRSDSLSMYRIDRMRRVMTHRGDYIDIREQYDMDDYISRAFHMFVNGKPTDLVLRFRPQILREVVSRFGESIHLRVVDDSWYEAIIKDQSYSRGLAMWILMLGENAYVVSPTHIREDIKRELDKTLMYYKKGVF